MPPPRRLVKRGPRTRPHLPDGGLEAPQAAALDRLVQKDSGRGGVQQLQVIVEANQQPQPARGGKGPWRSWGAQRRPLGTDRAGGQSCRWAPGAALSPSPGPSAHHHRLAGQVPCQPRFTEGHSETRGGQVTRPRRAVELGLRSRAVRLCHLASSKRPGGSMVLSWPRKTPRFHQRDGCCRPEGGPQGRRRNSGMLYSLPPQMAG